MENTSSTSGWKVGVILFLMLVVLPGVSWYYLQSGANYRKELIGKLGNYGQMPVIQATNYDGKVINTQKQHKGIFVVNFSDFEPGESTEDKILFLQKLHKQFDNRKDVFFLNYVADTSFFAPSVLEGFLTQNNFLDPAQLLFLPKGDVSAERDYHFSFDSNENVDNNRLVALIDMDSEIRGYCDVSDKASRELLVKHIAILLPVVKKRKLPKVNE